MRSEIGARDPMLPAPAHAPSGSRATSSLSTRPLPGSPTAASSAHAGPLARRELAAWLVANRGDIEASLGLRLGPAAPAAGDPESEALRRFRSFAGSCLIRGELTTPSLEGLRPNERRVIALLDAWADAAAHIAGPRGADVKAGLRPLIEHFRVSLRSTRASIQSRGAPRSTRRVVSAAIDRISDAFLAIDTDTGRILDANPAAGSLLALKRDALLGVDAMRFVPEHERPDWWSELDACAESDRARLFRGHLLDTAGLEIAVEASVNRFETRGMTLALITARPAHDTAQDGKRLSPARAPA